MEALRPFRKSAAGRISLLDAARGVCVVMMIAYHAIWNAMYVFSMPPSVFSNPVMDAVRYFFAFAFVFICGISSRLSRSNLRRGIKCLALALVITAASCLAGQPVYFGALHLLSLCMLGYGAYLKLFPGKASRPAPAAPEAPAPGGEGPARPRETAPEGVFAGGKAGGIKAGELVPAAVLAALAALSGLVTIWFPVTGSGPGALALWFFGWQPGLLASADYFPVFPWVFLFLLGVWAGGFVASRRVGPGFYAPRSPALAAIGRRSLLIYMLHVPVLYGAMLLLRGIL